MINIYGNGNASLDSVHCFEGYEDFITAFKAIELANKLGLTIKQKSGGSNWLAFERNGKVLSNVSFFKPAHAYAFLLGVAAILEVEIK